MPLSQNLFPSVPILVTTYRQGKNKSKGYSRGIRNKLLCRKFQGTGYVLGPHILSMLTRPSYIFWPQASQVMLWIIVQCLEAVQAWMGETESGSIVTIKSDCVYLDSHFWNTVFHHLLSVGCITHSRMVCSLKIIIIIFALLDPAQRSGSSCGQEGFCTGMSGSIRKSFRP